MTASGMRPRLNIWRGGLLAVMLLLSHAGPAAVASDPRGLAVLIDRRLEEAWSQAHISPPGDARDEAFLRRAYLDLVGRVPTVGEARAFLDERPGNDADASHARRENLVAGLTAGPAHARHMATFWRRSWLPQTETPQFAGLAAGFDRWLFERLRRRAAYDEIVRELIATELAHPRWLASRDGDNAAATTFFAVADMQPENMAANAARAFLGVNLDCAQCHDHPFARWTREEFYGTAAFFARPTPGAGESSLRFVLAIPGTNDVVTARTLAGATPDWPEMVDDEAGRRLFADWMVSRQNPFFARNAVNRLWAWFFGRGLVEPLDDLSATGPPSPPDLLDELAAAFADSGFDLPVLASALTLTRAYRLSSAASDEAAALFAGMSPRGLTGEQLYDSLATAAGRRVRLYEPADEDDEGRQRRRFVDQFKIDRPATAERSISQALALMNGSVVGTATNADEAQLLAAAAGAPFLDDRRRLEIVFLATLSRYPQDGELQYLLPHLERNSHSEPQRRRALADILWALCNTSEFNTNH